METKNSLEQTKVIKKTNFTNRNIDRLAEKLKQNLTRRKEAQNNNESENK